MKFENSKYFNTLTHKLIELPFGKFYLCEEFMISEIDPEIHFDWEMIETLIPFLIEHYGEDINIAYISNRVHSYSFDPNSWIKFERDYDFVFTGAVVYYDELNEINAALEKKIMKNSLKPYRNLDEAINWVLNLIKI